jgi:nicotinamidase-related amidase
MVLTTSCRMADSSLAFWTTTGLLGEPSPVSRLCQSSSRALKCAAEIQKAARLRVILLLILFVFQGLYPEPTAAVVWAITTWDDRDADDGDGIKPLSISDVLSSLTHSGQNRRLAPSHVPPSTQSPGVSRLIARAPPNSSSHTPSCNSPYRFVLSGTVRSVRTNRAQAFAAGTWGGEFHPEFGPRRGDAVVLEHWAQSGFANTDLDAQLKQRGIVNIILVGMIANTCVESTARFGMELDYHVTLVGDATAAFSHEVMHAAHEVNEPSFAHSLLTTKELLAQLPDPSIRHVTRATRS